MSKDGFEGWLARCVERWPVEARSMLGPALSSPESALSEQSEGSWARGAFPGMDGDWREFDRAALSLRCLWELSESGSLDRLGARADPAWARLLSGVEGQSGGLDALAYATLFNDLGKLGSTTAALAAAGRPEPADHDEAMLQAALWTPEKVCPGLSGLGAPWAELWREGMAAGFNAGMAMQMEAPRAGWARWLALGSGARAFHALHSYLDVLGAQGAMDPRAPGAIMGSRGFSSRFHAACFAGSAQGFEKGAAAELGMEGVGRPVLAAAMCARSDGPRSARVCAEALAGSSAQTREGLDWLWGEQSRMALQYAPALLAVDVSEPGLARGLEALGRAAQSLRRLANAGHAGLHGDEVGVGNIAAMASARARGDAGWNAPGRWQTREGGWLWSME